MCQSLIVKYEEIREGIAGEGVAADWECPEVLKEDGGISVFVKTRASLRKYYESIMVHLVPVLTSHEVSNSTDWQQWLGTLVQSKMSPNLRFMVIELDETRVLDELCEAHPERIVTVQPDLDMPGAHAELVRDVPGSGPGFTFRRLFIALTSAASIGNLAAAQQAADRALKVAVEQNWPQMQTVVHMALGSACLAKGDTAATLKCYRCANQAIAGKDDPVAPKLDIQTRFAEGAVLVGEQEYEEAAEIYEQIAPLAEKQEDHFALLESRRMASYCRQQAGQFEQAWTEGQKALDTGAILDDETRGNSTLPYVGQCLLQLIEDRHVEAGEKEIRQRMVELVGEDWEEKLAQRATATAT